MLIPVVLSGGSGTRLWPVSRTKHPKQFARIFERSLQEMTLHRLSHFAKPWIVTNIALKDLTLAQARAADIPSNQIIFETQSKNTAPAIALICKVFQSMFRQDDIVGIFPSDHLIENEDAFFAALKVAETEARAGRIVTLGITPTLPATGYGYIQAAPSGQGGLSAQPVHRFHEKPDLKTAESFLKAGGFYWNAGIFVFKVSTMTQALASLQPRLWDVVSKLKDDRSNMAEIFAEVENISIDYAVLEKLSPTELTCIPCDIGWNDIGSWDAIAAIFGDEKSRGQIEVQGHGNFVHGGHERVYAFAGVSDLIVVETKDAVLITQKGMSQTVKDVVDVLRTKNNSILNEHPEAEKI